MCPTPMTINSQKLGRRNEQTQWEFAVNLPKRRPRPPPCCRGWQPLPSCDEPQWSGAIDTNRGNVHAKDQGQKSRSQRSKQILPQFEHVHTVTPVWIHIWQPNDAQSLKWHRKCGLLFLAATKQLYEWFSPSVCLSVCVSVSLSVRPSVCTYVTPFWLCSHHRIIMKFSGVITNDRSDVHAKSQGQR